MSRYLTFSTLKRKAALLTNPLKFSFGHRIFPSYTEHQAKALDPATREVFWAEQAKETFWKQPYSKVLDESKAPIYKWFTGGLTNLSYSCIDRHVHDGRGKDLAMIYESAYTRRIQKFSYNDLQDSTSRLAKVFANNGVKKGDRVIIYMPMIPEAFIASHACLRIGAIASVVFGGFASEELANRIKQTDPKLIVTASVGIEVNRIIPYAPRVDKALELVGKPEIKRLIVQRKTMREKNLNKQYYLDFSTELAKIPHNQGQDVVFVEGDHPSYIIFTSGSTGQAKGVYRSHGGTMVSLNYIMKHMFDIHQKDVMMCPADLGWIVGHVFVLYGPLLRGAASVMFEGKPIGTPNVGVLFRMIQEHQVKAFVTSPTGIKFIMSQDYDGEMIKQHDFSKLKSVHLSGERSSPDSIEWLQKMIPSVMVNDNLGQTESGQPIISNYANLGDRFKIKPGSTAKPCVGYDIRLMDEQNNEITEPHQLGKLVAKLPCPPGHMDGLWGNDQDYIDKYLSEIPGHYIIGDAGYFDEEGYFYVMTRLDDAIKVSGHRLSTGRMEEVLHRHPNITDCAVVGKKDNFRGEVPIAFVVLASQDQAQQTIEELNEAIKSQVGQFAKLYDAVIVKRLPKNRSGKTLRYLLRALANGEEAAVTSTIEDEAMVEEVRKALEAS